MDNELERKLAALEVIEKARALVDRFPYFPPEPIFDDWARLEEAIEHYDPVEGEK